jgi:uncharacterized protein YerC
MSQVSRKPLGKENWDKIFDLFVKSLSSINKEEDLSIFLNDFLSYTERIVLAKRFACAFLLAKGWSYDGIRDFLHITPPTIAKMSTHIKYQGKGLLPVVERAMNKQEFEIFLEEIKDFDLPKRKLFDSTRLSEKYRRERVIAKKRRGI